jgi:hypothetical protein
MLFSGAQLHPQRGITDDQFKAVAEMLKVEVAVIKAFAAVETGMSPFDKLGRPTILYERKWFSELSKHSFDATHPHISNRLPYQHNPKSKPRPKHAKKAVHGKHAAPASPASNAPGAAPLGPTGATGSAPAANPAATPAAPAADKPFNPVQDNPNNDYYGFDANQYPRLQEAYALDAAAALGATSWGRFQVLALNFKSSNYASVQAFVLDMMQSEGAHLRAYAGYVLHKKPLLEACRKKDWKNMALLYNGPTYAQNHYDKKLSDAYDALTKKK